jgi:hypothetical protein
VIVGVRNAAAAIGVAADGAIEARAVVNVVGVIANNIHFSFPFFLSYPSLIGGGARNMRIHLQATLRCVQYGSEVAG